jgi:hypothetical protein
MGAYERAVPEPSSLALLIVTVFLSGSRRLYGSQRFGERLDSLRAKGGSVDFQYEHTLQLLHESCSGKRQRTFHPSGFFMLGRTKEQCWEAYPSRFAPRTPQASKAKLHIVWARLQNEKQIAFGDADCWNDC